MNRETFRRPERRAGRGGRLPLFFIGKEFLFCALVVLALRNQSAARQRGVEKKTGRVSFITPLNVYVTFENTGGITPGDTLYSGVGNTKHPVIIVKYLSSTSCAGPVVGIPDLKVGDIISAYVARPVTAKPRAASLVSAVDSGLAGRAGIRNPTPSVSGEAFNVTRNQRIFGGFAANSYSNFSNLSGVSDVQRWNYSMSLYADNIEGSDFYFSNYMYMTYMSTQWKQVAADPLSSLRVFDLSLSYRTRDFNVWAGRHVDNDISGVGPIDGIVAEERLGSFIAGEVIGSRPDFYTLGLNPALFQFGGYVTNVDTMSAGVMRNTIGAFQQYNEMETDRRFIYFQHSSAPFRSVSVYASGQIDIFKLSNGKPANEFSPVNLYFSAAYYPANQLSLNLSYTAQRNIIYYRTFGSTVDSLLESENQLRNDARIDAYFRPYPFTFINVGADYSFQQGDINATRNANLSFTQSNIPLLHLTAGLSYSKIMSGFLDGSVIGISISKSLPFNSTRLTIMYSRLDYRFGGGTMKLVQDQPSFQLTTSIPGNLFLNLYYQGTYSGRASYGTLMGGISERF